MINKKIIKRMEGINTKAIAKIYKYSFLLLVSSIIFYSCTKESNPVTYQGNNDEIYPLAVGNIWQYSKTAYDIDYNIIAKDTFSTEIDMSYFKNEVEWFGIASSWVQVSRQSDGIWMQHTQAPVEPVPSLVYKYPTYSGDSYPYWNVISTQKIIKIGLGYFRTVQYRFLKNSETNEYIDYFLCPGIGLIKSKSVRKDSSGIFYTDLEEELINYTVN